MQPSDQAARVVAIRGAPQRRSRWNRSLGALLIGVLAASTAIQIRSSWATTPVNTSVSAVHPGLRRGGLEDLERRTFAFFWDTANPRNGLVADRYPYPPFASIAAVGYGLTAYPIGVERGYVTRAQAVKRVLVTLKFLRDAPQGEAETGFAGYKGFYYHFIDMETGVRHRHIELSTVDTTLLLGGVLFCEGYFNRKTPAETELRRLAEELYRRVDWTWASRSGGAVVMGWSPEHGFERDDWRGYNEAMLTYVLGLGSPTHPLVDGAWKKWTDGYEGKWKTEYGQTYLTFPPLFGHQFSHIWIDFRGIADDYMRGHGIDYFENSRRATYAQQAYAVANPMHWKAYGARLFGISAGDGPVDATLPWGGETRRFYRYAAHGIGGAANYDDGTLSPSALVSSIVFAPEIVLPAIAEMQKRYGAHIYLQYGYVDTFNPSFDFDVPLGTGRRIPGVGWVASDYLGIDQGSIIGMLGNYEGGLVWRVMRKNAAVRRGLKRAGFRGGWLDAPP